MFPLSRAFLDITEPFPSLPDCCRLLRIGSSYSRIPALFQAGPPCFRFSGAIYIVSCCSALSPDYRGCPDCSGFSRRCQAAPKYPKLFRVVLGQSILLLIVTDRSAPAPDGPRSYQIPNASPSLPNIIQTRAPLPSFQTVYKRYTRL